MSLIQIRVFTIEHLPIHFGTVILIVRIFILPHKYMIIKVYRLIYIINHDMAASPHRLRWKDQVARIQIHMNIEFVFLLKFSLNQFQCLITGHCLAQFYMSVRIKNLPCIKVTQMNNSIYMFKIRTVTDTLKIVMVLLT